MDRAHRNPEDNERPRAPSLPPELWSEVSKHLVTSDPVETARDLSSFELAGHVTHNAVDGSRVGRFRQHLNRLGRLSKSWHDIAIPEDGLETWPHAPEPDPEGRFAEPQQRVSAAIPALGFQTAKRKRAFVDEILRLDADSQGEVLARIGPGFDDLDDECQQRLIARSLEYFLETGSELWSTRDGSAKFLVEVHDCLKAHQKAEILDNLRARPALARLYSQAIAASYQRRTTSTTSTLGADNAPTKANIDHLAKKVAPTPLSPQCRMKEFRSTGSSIHEVYKQMRAELMNTSRSRDRSL